jgi:hypothetical protein
MKRIAHLLTVALMTLYPHAGWAAETTEEVVGRAMGALNHGRLDTFVKAMHPDALKEVRASVLEVLDLATKEGKEAQLLKAFDVKDAEALKALDAPQMFTAMLRKATSAPEAKKALAATRIDVVGHFFAGTDKAYVVYRSKMNLGKLNIDRLNAASLLRSGTDWKLSLLDDFAGQIAAMKQGLSGEAVLPDIKATKVEPLGHVLEGKKTAMVVYRMVTPVGESSMTKLAVLSVNASDPGWEAVRKDETEKVTTLIEKSLGIRRVTPEMRAAQKKTAERMLEQVKAQHAKNLSRNPEQMPELGRMNRQSDAPELPEGMIALPDKFFGPNRDRFHDIAPKGSVLVGAHVSYIMKFGSPKISSVRPVYRVGGKNVEGKRYGTLQSKEVKAIAKPGYAVGAVNTHTGLTVDGFELVFMRIAGDHLDTSDSYTSPWLGDIKGGSPRDVSSEGKLPVGLHGRAGKEVNALGLIVGE